ncbi:MAG: response regulator [Vulcanimicrobiota bacterium]
MRALIVEDELASRALIQEILEPVAECKVATNGNEAIEAFVAAWADKAPFDFICFDIKMPGMDGKTALKKIRDIEKEMGVKGSEEVRAIMTTGLDDARTVVDSFFQSGATSYIVKPITQDKLFAEMKKLKIL